MPRVRRREIEKLGIIGTPRSLHGYQQRRTRIIGPCIVRKGSEVMDSVIYLVGLIVVIMFILSAFGLR